MEEWQSRTGLLLGEENLERLHRANLLVVGVGGVGAYAAEMLVRAGVGNLTIIDSDTVTPSNINRQLIALHSTVGKAKTEVLTERLRDISPRLNITARQEYLEAERVAELFADETFDFVVDAIDTVAPKTALLIYCLRHKIRVVSSMGAGGRVDPAQIRIADIAETRHCGLARAVRHQLRANGFSKGLKVVFSTEQPDRNAVVATENERNKKSTVGTVSYLPALFGCYLASHVIRKLTDL